MDRSGCSAVVQTLDDTKLSAWFTHTANCFAWKGTPKEHFEQHYYLDPNRKASAIFVAISPESDLSSAESIWSSLRVFDRDIFVKGKKFAAGGIGEVCTKEQHKRKGLCKRLLLEAIASMRCLGITFGALHCAADLMPLYASVGFISCPAHFVQRTFRASYEEASEQNDGCCYRVRVIDYSDTALLQCLSDVHEESNRRFDGPVSRHELSYWAYVAYNTQRCGYWLERTASGKSLPSSASTIPGSGDDRNQPDSAEGRRPAGAVAAMAALKKERDGSGFILADFGADGVELERDGGASALAMLVGHALRTLGVPEAQLRFPAPVAAAMPPPPPAATSTDSVAAAAPAPALEDRGYMYLPLPDHNTAAVGGGEAAAGLGTAFDPARHVFWAADGY